jgi:hypothetical protein
LIEGGHQGIHLGYSTVERKRQLESELRSIQGQIASSELGTQRENLAGMEQQFRGQLERTTGEAMESVDALLGRELESIGIEAGEARQLVGTVAAQRGLGRSTMALEQQGEVNLQEQQAKGSARSTAFGRKSDIAKTERKTLENIRQQRQLIEDNFKQMEVDFANSAEFAEAENAIKMDLQNYMQGLNMEMADYQSEMAIWSGVGQMAGFGVGLYAASEGAKPKVEDEKQIPLTESGPAEKMNYVDPKSGTEVA